MTAIIKKISGVRPHGDNLSIVTVDDMEVVANRLEDGSFRWEEGELCVYVTEASLVPEDVLKDRGYWDEEKGKGLLEGKQGNRVKMRRFAGHESRGLLFKVTEIDMGANPDDPHPLPAIERNGNQMAVSIGDDVSDFFDITEYQPPA